MATSFQNDVIPQTVKVPANYPKDPAPGKLSLLFEANKSAIYHKFNARDFDNGNLLFGSNILSFFLLLAQWSSSPKMQPSPQMSTDVL